MNESYNRRKFIKTAAVAGISLAAASQATTLTLLLNLARGATAGLSDNTANNGLKEVLLTAQISQHRNRVIANATLPQSLPIDLLNSGSNSTAGADAGTIPQ